MASHDVASSVCRALDSGGGGGSSAGSLSGGGGHPGEAVQVASIKRKLKAPGTKRFKLRYDEPLSNLVFNFDLRRYTRARRVWAGWGTASCGT